MMATNSHFCAWTLCFALLFLGAALGQSSLSSRLGGGPSRVKRNQCPDGAYDHGDMRCCKCPRGQHLVTHCVSSPNDGKCALCEEGRSYMSHPNYQDSCHRCTSCDHPHANMKVVDQCTPGRDTKCQCKDGHFCERDPCTVCQRCNQCESTGIKEPCNTRNDTICNDTAASNTGGIIAGVLIALAAIAAGLGFFFWRKRSAEKQKQEQAKTSGVSSSEAVVEMQPLRDLKVDILPHLPDIAEELGWKDMELLAIRSKIPDAAIESCQLDHRGDSQSQTLQLLRKWAERHGRNAPNELIRMLHESGKKSKAEKIYDILSNNSAG